jgi:hypothetical protein
VERSAGLVCCVRLAGPSELAEDGRIGAWSAPAAFCSWPELNAAAQSSLKAELMDGGGCSAAAVRFAGRQQQPTQTQAGQLLLLVLARRRLRLGFGRRAGLCDLRASYLVAH